MTEQLPEEIIEAIDLTKEIADQLDRRRREPSNIAAAATIACWYLGSGQLEDIGEGLDEIGLSLIEAFGGDEDDAEEEEGDPEGCDETEDEGGSGDSESTAADPDASDTTAEQQP